MNSNYFLAMHDRNGICTGEILSINDNYKNIEEIIRKYFNEKYNKNFHYDGYWIVENIEPYEIVINKKLENENERIQYAIRCLQEVKQTLKVNDSWCEQIDFPLLILSEFENLKEKDKLNVEEDKIDDRPFSYQCGGAGICYYDDYGRCDAPNGICNPK